MSTSAMEYLETLEEGPVRALLRRWRGEVPDAGAVVLLPERERATIPAIQAACRSEEVSLVGAVFPALAGADGFTTRGAWLLRLDDARDGFVHAGLPIGDDSPAGVAEGIARTVEPRLADGDEVTLLLLVDALFPQVGSLLEQLYLRLADRVHYMGANAGNETFSPIPCLFDAARAVQGGIATILLRGVRGAVVEHGYRMPDQLISATSTDGNRILEIDWRPAFEVYQEMARALHRVEITPETFYRFAVHYPFGIVAANGTLLVRIPVSLEPDGSLFCVGEVPPNSLLTLLAAPVVGSTDTIERIVRGLRALAPVAGRDLLAFYCAGRRLHEGEDAACAELRELARRAEAGRMAGALSLGEIGTTSGGSYPLFHNATVVASAWGRP